MSGKGGGHEGIAGLDPPFELFERSCLSYFVPTQRNATLTRRQYRTTNILDRNICSSLCKHQIRNLPSSSNQYLTLITPCCCFVSHPRLRPGTPTSRPPRAAGLTECTPLGCPLQEVPARAFIAPPPPRVTNPASSLAAAPLQCPRRPASPRRRRPRLMKTAWRKSTTRPWRTR